MLPHPLKRYPGTLFLCLFMAISPALIAQTVTGTVIDLQTDEPLAGANIIQTGTSNGVSAGSDGSFTLSLRNDEAQMITISFIGYKTQTLEVAAAGQALEIRMMPETIRSNEVFVEALRVDEATPMAYENITRKEIEEKNLGQDIPYMLAETPSVTTTSDAGAGIGYTGLRIRGIDQRRINVTINGIPVNDTVSHGEFLVNLAHCASALQRIQLQRGVGTSTNRAVALGATMNIQASQMQPEAFGEINAAVGSYGSRKANVRLGSVLMENGWQFQGRLSKIETDGYIDRAFSDLKSFYLSAARHGEHSLLRADVFSGKQQNYHAWNGVSESKLESGDRTYNSAGTEKPGEPYEDQTDNYQQDHYQLHYWYDFTDYWNANISLHYTYGRGYYEEYKADQLLSEYEMNPIQLPDTTIARSDLVRRPWLDNHFY